MKSKRLYSLLLLVCLLLGISPCNADFATPFAESHNKLGEVSTAGGYLVAMDSSRFLVLVGTDTLDHVVLNATAGKGVVGESLLGRVVKITARITKAGSTGIRPELEILRVDPVNSGAASPPDKMSNPEDAEASAQSDLQGGTPKYYVIGQPAAHDQSWRTILKQEYGVELVLLGCVPVPPVSDHASRYNAVVLPELKKKHGEDFLKISEEKAKNSPVTVHLSQPTLHNGDVPVGSLGFPVGSYLTVEGVEAERMLLGCPLRVDTVNGVKLAEPVILSIQNIDALPKDGRVVLKGYESLQMIGASPAALAAAKEAGREATPQPQAGWQVHLTFFATSVVSSAEVKIKQAP